MSSTFDISLDDFIGDNSNLVLFITWWSALGEKILGPIEDKEISETGWNSG